MRYVKNCTVLLAGLAALAMATQSHAIPVGYTDVNAFAAQPGSFTTHSFLSELGQTIGDGSSITIPHSQGYVDVSFFYDFGDVPGDVPGTMTPIEIAGTDGSLYGGGGPFSSTSPSAFLGTTDGDMFIDGDDFRLDFSRPLSQLGMFFISADELFDGDIELTAGGTTVGIDASSPSQVLDDGSSAYFLGLIDMMGGGMTSASITTIGGGYFFYNVDNLMVAPVPSPVPSPAPVGLLALGLLALACARFRKHQQGEVH